MRRVLLLLCVLLTACYGGSSPPELPTDPQIINGVLVPTELSRTRRGTHLFKSHGKELYYVESRTQSLRPFEYFPITGSGILQHNIDPHSQLPVLVLSHIAVREGDLEEHNLAEVQINIRSPNVWRGEQGVSAYNLFSDNRTQPLVSIVSEEADEPFAAFIRQLQYDRSLSIDGHQAVEVHHEQTGQRIVYVDRSEQRVTVSFTPQNTRRAEQWHDAFYSLLRSMQIGTAEDEDDDDTGNVPTSGGSDIPDWINVDPAVGSGPVHSALNRPCGGPAGVLCPANYYCSITDFSDGVGKCQALE